MDFELFLTEFVGPNAVILSSAAFIIISIFLGVRIVPQSEKFVVERALRN